MSADAKLLEELNSALSFLEFRTHGDPLEDPDHIDTCHKYHRRKGYLFKEYVGWYLSNEKNE